MQSQHWTDFVPASNSVSKVKGMTQQYFHITHNVLISSAHNNWRLELVISRAPAGGSSIGIITESVRPGKYQFIHAAASDFTDADFEVRLRHPSNINNYVVLFDETSATGEWDF